MIECRRLSPVLVVVAAACLPLLLPHPATAQQGAPGAKAPAPPCTDFPPPPRIEDTKDVAALTTFLNKNYEITKQCAQETIKSIDLVRSGGKDWDFADKSITQQIDQARELVQLMQYDLVPKLEKLIGDIEDSATKVGRTTRDVAEQERKRAALKKMAGEFKDVVGQLGARSGALAKEATAMEGDRPRLAELAREKAWGEILDRAKTISAAILKQADAMKSGLQALSGDPSPRPGVNP